MNVSPVRRVSELFLVKKKGRLILLLGFPGIYNFEPAMKGRGSPARENRFKECGRRPLLLEQKGGFQDPGKRGNKKSYFGGVKHERGVRRRGRERLERKEVANRWMGSARSQQQQEPTNQQTAWTANSGGVEAARQGMSLVSGKVADTSPQLRN